MAQSFGGTNCGRVAAPVVYSSYDYGAPLTESRVVRDRPSSSLESHKTSNLDTSVGFYWITHNTTASTVVVPFGLNVETSIGNVTIPNARLDGRKSKNVVTDYTFGEETLLFSIAEVLIYPVVDKKPTLVFYINTGQTANLALKGLKGQPTVYGDLEVTTSTFQDKHSLITYIQTSGKTVLQFRNGPQLLFIDRITGWNIWAP
ncbi:beta-galactosidase, domain 2-domain-containing protein [Terfezia claveryi]|nr:beta-galactosidase, domain 2-domain-containing protein [Terfezia claveryi]